jgi:hypothetical protein
MPRTDLSLHNYTLFANVLAMPLLPWLGPVGSYNVLWMLFAALNGYCVFLLARYLTGRVFESWLAGAMFALSPVLVARSTAHLSLLSAFPLALVALYASRALNDG